MFSVMAISFVPLPFVIVIVPLLKSNDSLYLYSVLGVFFMLIAVTVSFTDTLYVVVFVSPFSV